MTMRAPVAILALAAALWSPAANLWAQAGGPKRVTQAYYQGQGPSSGLMGSQGPMVKSADYVDAHGDPAVIPAQYACPPGYGGYGGDMQGAYGDVGYNTDQVGPHYFDFMMEYVALRRGSRFTGLGTIVTENFVGNGVNPVVPALSTDDIDREYEPGFRIVGRYDVGPLSVLEFGYTGLYDMGGGARFIDPNADPATGLGNLFSIFTNFGATPPGGIDNAAPPNPQLFEETDRATQASIEFTADLHTTEMSLRRYWVGYSPRVTGTLLAGFRYTKLQEAFIYNSVGAEFLAGDPVNDPSGGISTASYRILGDNNLAGMQLGGDMWIGIIQGLRFGSEAKVGIYNNSYELSTTFRTSDGNPSITESRKHDQVAFITDAKLQLVADILPSLSIRGGYEVLFMNSLALVGDNFNTGSPYASAAVDPRVPFVEDQGNALFHGWSLGLEYIW